MNASTRFGTASLLTLLFALGCGDAVTTVTADELLANPAMYEGELLEVVGSPDGAGAQTLVACEHDGPCNNLWGGYYYAAESAFIQLAPSEAADWTVVARGAAPLPCFDSECTNGVTFGCHGNDVEAVCAPAVPARIATVVGRLEGSTLYVDELRLEGGPTTDGIYREVE